MCPQVLLQCICMSVCGAVCVYVYVCVFVCVHAYAWVHVCMTACLLIPLWYLIKKSKVVASNVLDVITCWLDEYLSDSSIILLYIKLLAFGPLSSKLIPLSVLDKILLRNWHLLACTEGKITAFTPHVLKGMSDLELFSVSRLVI